MTIAILTRSDFRSPRVLADSLKVQLEGQGAKAEISFEINLLNRLVSFKRSQLSFHFWLIRKIKNYREDNRLLKKLKNFDVIIISECIPNAFSKRLYDVEKLKKKIKKPIGLCEVYYLGNAPTQIDLLRKNKEALTNRYDFHLSLSNVTEIRELPSKNWYPIGIKAQSWKLKPLPKKEFIAIIDFAQPGYENHRKIQISALNKAGIKYISLEKPYSFKEIRNIYQQGAFFFIESPEAFGVSILECLCCGCQIFTPKSSWPMSWRLNEQPEVGGDGILPSCFTVYQNEEQLIRELASFKKEYDLVESPKKVFESFLSCYPDFYYGNDREVKRLLLQLKKEISNEKLFSKPQLFK